MICNRKQISLLKLPHFAKLNLHRFTREISQFCKIPRDIYPTSHFYTHDITSHSMNILKRNFGFQMFYCILNDHYFPVNGGYSEWGNYSQCSTSCGDGKKQRQRTCTNPAPQFKGKDCSRLGDPVQLETCNIQPCPSKLHMSLLQLPLYYSL